MSFVYFVLVGPVQAIARVVGVINGVEFNQTLIGRVIIDNDGYANVEAQLYDVPESIGKFEQSWKWNRLELVCHKNNYSKLSI